MIELIYRRNDDGRVYGITFQCPGCGKSHFMNTQHTRGEGLKWDFDNNEERPTISPSYRQRWTSGMEDPKYGEPLKDECCHFLLQDGVVKFCGDCTHELAGEEVAVYE